MLDATKKQELAKKILSLHDSLDGEEGTWILFDSKKLTAEDLQLCRQLILDQLEKNGKEVWFMNPGGQPVAYGDFELDEEFWSK